MIENTPAPSEIIDEALRSYPLEPAPASIYQKVMKQVGVQRSIPKFKLSWLDYALSGFVAMMAGLVLFLWQTSAISPHWSVKLANHLFWIRQNIRFTLRQFQPQVPVEIIIIGLVSLLFGLIFFTRRRAPLVRITP